MSPASNTPSEPPLHDFIDMEAYDVVAGEHHRKLRKAARNLYDDAGVDDIDQRLDYLVLQVTRDVWNDFVAVIDP